MIRHHAIAVLLVLSSTAVLAHSNHPSADAEEEAAMAAVVVEYHRLVALQDSSDFDLLAPAYMQSEMGKRADARTWRPSGQLPSWLKRYSHSDEEFHVGYQNDVEIVHTRILESGGMVLTHEVGSYRGDSWDSYNAWIMIRIDGTWLIGTSLHELPPAVIEGMRSPTETN